MGVRESSRKAEVLVNTISRVSSRIKPETKKEAEAVEKIEKFTEAAEEAIETAQKESIPKKIKKAVIGAAIALGTTLLVFLPIIGVATSKKTGNGINGNESGDISSVTPLVKNTVTQLNNLGNDVSNQEVLNLFQPSESLDQKNKEIFQMLRVRIKWAENDKVHDTRAFQAYLKTAMQQLNIGHKEKALRLMNLAFANAKANGATRLANSVVQPFNDLNISVGNAPGSGLKFIKKRK